MEYETRVGEFSGPLEKLLELIEAEKMDINEVSLAKVTDDFLRYLDKFKQGMAEDIAGETGSGAAATEDMERKFRIDLRVLADFVSVASKLIFLKSKYLLPGLALTEEEEADIKDLESRLHIYQQLKPAIKLINQLWATSHHSFSRPYFIGRGTGNIPGQTMFYPGKNLYASALAEALGGIFETMKTYDLETETIREKIVTLEEKITEVLGRIQKEGDMHFNNLSSEKSRSEMIVVFLAILHLAREQLVLLEQMDNFSDIMVKKK
ncbi:MAG: segregation/condensation protein A [Minisyncoccia bacterium]|jgi:segregation and condensation protein A